MTLPATMRALQLQAVARLEEVILPVPSPARDEALIRTLATTICTSDLNDIASNPFGTALPRVLGHEGAGVVAAVGEEVRGLTMGQRVTAHPVIPCGTCDSCRRGLGHLCDDMGHLALDRDGTFAEYFCLPVQRLRPIPDGMEAAVAALMEPVAVCLEAVRRARVSAGENVLVVGDGPFGIIIARLALRLQPARLVLVGRHDFRLRRVPEAVRINERAADDVAAAVIQATGGAGFDAAILAAATPEAVALCLRSLRARGRLAVFASIAEPVPIDLLRLQFKEIEMLGSCNDEDHLDEALLCLADPALGLEDIVTHRLPFAQWRRAIALASEGKDEALKVAITFRETAP